MDFNNFYISGNGNECSLQVSYLLTVDLNMTSRHITVTYTYVNTSKYFKMINKKTRF